LRGRVAIVLLDMGFHCLFAVAPGMNDMTGRDVSMVCRGFVASGLMMFGSFFMMASRVGKVFRDFFVVSCSLLRHGVFLQLNDPPVTNQRRSSPLRSYRRRLGRVATYSQSRCRSRCTAMFADADFDAYQGRASPERPVIDKDASLDMAKPSAPTRACGQIVSFRIRAGKLHGRQVLCLLLILSSCGWRGSEGSPAASAHRHKSIG
jgi:hypothetical protein